MSLTKNHNSSKPSLFYNDSLGWKIIGQANIVGYLQNSLLNHSHSQAYLFIGPKNVGKTTVAEKFINSLYCLDLNPEAKIAPCQNCLHCNQLVKKNHPDVFIVERKINEKTKALNNVIKIEQINELREKLNLHPFLNSYKFGVIKEANAMNNSGFNALLKRLEEPFDKTILILISDSAENIPATIISRCQTFYFNSVSETEIAQALKTGGLNNAQAQEIAKLSWGRPGRALTLAQDENLRQTYYQSAETFLSFKNLPLFQRLAIAKEAAESENFSNSVIDNAAETLTCWQTMARDILLTKNNNADLVFFSGLLPQITAAAGIFQSLELSQFIKAVEVGKNYLRQNVSPQMILENLVINF